MRSGNPDQCNHSLKDVLAVSDKMVTDNGSEDIFTRNSVEISRIGADLYDWDRVRVWGASCNFILLDRPLSIE